MNDINGVKSNGDSDYFDGLKMNDINDVKSNSDSDDFDGWPFANCRQVDDEGQASHKTHFFLHSEKLWYGTMTILAECSARDCKQQNITKVV